MRKTGFLAVAVLMTMTILAGCGSAEADSKASPANVDAKSIAGDLASKITYQDEMSEMDIDTASMFMNLSDVDVTNAVIYESTGATAEEIVVLECSSPAEASKAAGVFKTRVAEQKESFEDYVPEELDKLGKAVIATSGNFAILSVSDDADTAKQIISEYLK